MKHICLSSRALIVAISTIILFVVGLIVMLNMNNDNDMLIYIILLAAVCGLIALYNLAIFTLYVIVLNKGTSEKGYVEKKSINATGKGSTFILVKFRTSSGKIGYTKAFVPSVFENTIKTGIMVDVRVFKNLGVVVFK